MHLSPAQAASLLRIDEDLIFDWIRDEDLPATFYGERYWINKTRLLEWAQHKHLPLPVEGEIEAPVLESAFSRGAFLPDLHVDSFWDGLAALLRRAIASEGAVVTRMLELMSARENFGWEPAADYAIPLSDAPVIVQHPEATVHFASFSSPIPWQHRRTAVRGVWLILAPVAALHSNLVSRVSYALHDPGIVSLLNQRCSQEQILVRMRELSTKRNAIETTEDTNGLCF